MTYRVHMEMPVYSKLLEPMTLSETQLAECRACPFEDLGGEFPLPEYLLAKHSHPSSKVPLVTLVSSVCDLIGRGGDYFLLRHLWGDFTSSLGTREPQFTMNWSRSETVVSMSVNRPFLLGLIVLFFGFAFLGIVRLVVLFGLRVRVSP